VTLVSPRGGRYHGGRVDARGRSRGRISLRSASLAVLLATAPALGCSLIFLPSDEAAGDGGTQIDGGGGTIDGGGGVIDGGRADGGCSPPDLCPRPSFAFVASKTPMPSVTVHFHEACVVTTIPGTACQLESCEGSIPEMHPRAGTLRLAYPGITLTATRSQSGLYDFATPNGFWSEGSELNFSATGGPDIGPFSEVLVGPADLNTDFVWPGSHSLSQSLPLTWDDVSGTVGATIVLTWHESPRRVRAALLCTFGGGAPNRTLPASALSKLEDARQACNAGTDCFRFASLFAFEEHQAELDFSSSESDKVDLRLLVGGGGLLAPIILEP
jgi:hypothetical protein